MATTRPLEVTEITAVFDSITGRYAERNKAMVALAIAGAMRATELVSLNVGDVWNGRLVKSTIDLREETTKFDKGGSITLGEEVQVLIADFLNWKQAQGEPVGPSDPLFLSQKGGHMSRQHFFHIVKEAFFRAGIEQSPHALRKTGGTWFHDETKDMAATQQFLRHSNLAVTQRYLRVSVSKVREYADTLGRKLVGAIKGVFGKSDSRSNMSDFASASTGDLITELGARGLDVTHLLQQLQAERLRRERKANVVSIEVARRKRAG